MWAGFEATSGFPKVIGAIDGTHINIIAPKNCPEAYINRKGHHSIQLQVIYLFSLLEYNSKQDSKQFVRLCK